jgi:hypothetical protein
MPPDSHEPLVLDLCLGFETKTRKNRIEAPDIRRMEVKEAGSITSSLRANLHRTELAAKAIIARLVKTRVLVKNFRFIVLIKIS